MTGGVLLGIARKAYPRAPMEALASAVISPELGVEGDWRGVAKPGRSNRRQVTLFAREDWEAALAELGATAHWTGRRGNLYVEGFALPRRAGTRIRVGDAAVLEVTGECDPCVRMEAVAEGLFEALKPGWRGGLLMRAVAPGAIRVGDQVRVED